MKNTNVFNISLILAFLVGCSSNVSSSTVSSSSEVSSTTNSSTSSSNVDLLPIKVEEGTEGLIKIMVEQGSKEAYEEVLSLYNEYANTMINFLVVEQGEEEKDDLFEPDVCIYTFNSLEYHDMRYSQLYEMGNPKLKDHIEKIYTEDIVSQLMTDGSLYAVPYSFSTNVLYYNKSIVTDEEVKTFEGLSEAAKRVSTDSKKVKAVSYIDSQMHRYATTLLAKKYDDKTTSLVLNANNSSLCGDDVISTTKWMNKYYLNENGYKKPSSDGYEFDLMLDNNGLSNILSVVAPASSYYHERIKSILGDNLGIASIPSFSVEENVKFKGGSFATINYYGINKFIDNKDTRVPVIESVIAFLTTKNSQELLYEKTGILPLYDDSELVERSNDISIAQMEMKDYYTLYPLESSFYIRFNEEEYVRVFYESLIFNKNVSKYEEIKNTLKKMEDYLNTGKTPSVN